MAVGQQRLQMMPIVIGLSFGLYFSIFSMPIASSSSPPRRLLHLWPRGLDQWVQHGGGGEQRKPRNTWMSSRSIKWTIIDGRRGEGEDALIFYVATGMQMEEEHY